MIVKVRALGIRENVAGWIENWFKHIRQRVVISGEFSKWVDVNIGMPQGSVLGPLLYYIYINDLNKLAKFADDTKIGNRVDSKEHAINIQSYLD